MTLSDGAGAISALAARVLARVRAGASLSTALEEQAPPSPSSTSTWSAPAKAPARSTWCWSGWPICASAARDPRDGGLGDAVPGDPGGRLAVLVFLLLAFVVPQFETIFKDAGAALPTPTAIVIAIGRFAQDYGWLVGLGIVAAVIAVRRLLAIPGPRLAWDRARCACRCSARLLRLLADGPVLPHPVDPGRQRRRPAHGHRPVARRDLEHRRRRRDGDRHERRATRPGLADPLAEIGVFPPLAVADAAGRRRDRQNRHDRLAHRRPPTNASSKPRSSAWSRWSSRP